MCHQVRIRRIWIILSFFITSIFLSKNVGNFDCFRKQRGILKVLKLRAWTNRCLFSFVRHTFSPQICSHFTQFCFHFIQNRNDKTKEIRFAFTARLFDDKHWKLYTFETCCVVVGVASLVIQSNALLNWMWHVLEFCSESRLQVLYRNAYWYYMRYYSVFNCIIHCVSVHSTSVVQNWKSLSLVNQLDSTTMSP